MTIALDLSQQRKETAEAWFQSLQERIFKAFEALEDDAPGPFAPLPETQMAGGSGLVAILG